uniref:Uncharacterized protein n=1 Tax=Anguilla anguilla TaxID=7936 RepID=A0A0E9RMG4_ANGAN
MDYIDKCRFSFGQSVFLRLHLSYLYCTSCWECKWWAYSADDITSWPPPPQICSPAGVC